MSIGFSFKSINTKIAVPSVIGGFTIGIVVLICSSYAENRIALNGGLQMADLIVKQSLEMRKVYSNQIMPKIKESGGTDSPEWENEKNSVPTAATLVNIVGHNLSKSMPGVSLKLYSEHPFKNRNLKIDEYEKRALESFKKDNTKPFYEIVKKDNMEILRYSVADIMTENCVKYHNNHPLSTKTDWKNGDLRGAIEVELPLNSLNNSIIEQFHILQFLLISIILLMMLGLWYVARRIVKDAYCLQNGLNNFFSYLNREKTSMKLIDLKSKDEFGQMAEQINENILKIKNLLEEDMKAIGETVIVADKVEKGIYTSRVNSRSSNAIIDTFIKAFNNMLDKTETNFKNVKTTLESYTSNDYTKKIAITDTVQEDMLAVMQSVNQLGETLKKQAEENFENGKTLSNNSKIMSKSVHNVAQKANQQAASLEETAAAVEEIFSIIKNTAETTLQMSNLSTQVTQSAEESKQLAIRTAESMEQINAQVKSINDAITIIDQISFQTNILSLNAAVEAATAGESGKGFAVVAQEVRNLANRSAEAAKEIKKIVEAATLKAEEGKDISALMINEYQNLSNNISQTIKLINDVSTGSQEQSKGVEQINDVINQLDRATQENATEAERVSAVANEIQEMANVLVIEANQKKYK